MGRIGELVHDWVTLHNGRAVDTADDAYLLLYNIAFSTMAECCPLPFSR